MSHTVTTSELKPGDHVYVWRKFSLYQHHAIYIGDKLVIEFSGGHKRNSNSNNTNNNNNNSDDEDVLSVREGTLAKFVNGGTLKRVKYGVSLLENLAKMAGSTCWYKSDAANIVIQRAKRLAGARYGENMYHFFDNNCEAVCVYCKIGPESGFNPLGEFIEHKLNAREMDCDVCRANHEFNKPHHASKQARLGMWQTVGKMWKYDLAILNSDSTGSSRGAQRGKGIQFGVFTIVCTVTTALAVVGSSLKVVRYGLTAPAQKIEDLLNKEEYN